MKVFLDDQKNWRSAIFLHHSISTPRLSWSSSLSVISWLLVISSLVIVLVTGWNPVIHTIVKAWVFLLVFLGVTKRSEDVTDESEVGLFHKRVFWLAVILVATPLVGLYVYRSDNTKSARAFERYAPHPRALFGSGTRRVPKCLVQASIGQILAALVSSGIARAHLKNASTE